MNKCIEKLINHYLPDEIDHFVENSEELGGDIDNHIVGTWIELIREMEESTRGKNLTS